MKIKIGSPKKWANRGRHFIVKQPLQSFIVVGIIALVGGFTVYRSLALSGLQVPSDADSLVLELDKGDGALLSDNGQQLLVPDPLAFRLYSNGLAICGNPASQTLNQPQYLATTLSRAQINTIVDRIKQANFLKLNSQYYVLASRLDGIADTITLNLNANSYSVTYFRDGGPKPAGYQAAQAAIEQLCASIHTPYKPDQVIVKTKQVNSNLGQPVKNIGISNTDLPDATVPTTQKALSGKQADQAVTDVNDNAQKVYKHGDKLYQSIVIPVLPDVHQSPEKHVPQIKTGRNIVHADGNRPIQFAWFCPTDSCVQSVNLGETKQSVQDFYFAHEYNYIFDTPPITVLHGGHPSSYYTACQPSTGRPCYADPLENTYENIYAEFGGFPFVRYELALGFSTNSPTYCGFGSQPGNLAVSEARCVNFSPAVMAHELGHNFSLGHVASPLDDIMTPNAGVCAFPLCTLSNTQAFTVLANNQDYFHPVPANAAIFYQVTNVSGRVTIGNAGVPGIKINTCTSQTPTTDSNGNFSFTAFIGTGYCVRLGSSVGVSTMEEATNNNTDSPVPGGYTAKSYEYQVAGVSCYHFCSGGSYYWDRSTDGGFDFKFAESRAIVASGTDGWVLDSFGLLNGFGTKGSYVLSGWRGGVSKFRALDANATLSGYALDTRGNLYPFESSVPAAVNAPKFSFDIARDFKLIPDSAYTGGNTTFKGYVLDGWGGIHSINGAPGVSGGAYWQGWDIARKMVVRGDGTGGYVLDGYGGLHAFRIGAGATPPVAHVTGYWNGWDIARSAVLKPDGTGGYVLDGYGGIHPFSTGSSAAPPAPKSFAYWNGWDIAKDIVVTDWTNFKGYTLDGYGGRHTFSP